MANRAPFLFRQQGGTLLGHYTSKSTSPTVSLSVFDIFCTLSLSISNGTTRYNDLLRNIKGISNTMLSKSLRELEDAELFKRFEYLEIPVRVEYVLIEKAVRLQPILLELIQWEIERETGGRGK
ncbi:MAG: helix-turn-helix transcriptional regulator [Ruminococcaceae bacterium]|nr:helix-turn-helix transcriptional regulator [Oscillospiraceae bacterium]